MMSLYCKSTCTYKCMNMLVKKYIYINVLVNAYVISFQLITSMHMYIVLHVYDFQFIQCTTLLTIIHSLSIERHAFIRSEIV